MFRGPSTPRVGHRTYSRIYHVLESGPFRGERSPRADCELNRTSSEIVEQNHEAKIHVKLLVAVKQSQARIVGDEIDFRLLIASQHHHVFENSRGGLSAQARQFEAVPVQMDRVNVITSVSQAQSIPLALFQVE
jgi:hypothetical protein